MNLSDTKINVITKDGKPQRIEVDGKEIRNVTAFQYNADGSLNITLYGNVKFVEETKEISITVPTDFDTKKFINEFQKCNTGRLRGVY